MRIMVTGGNGFLGRHLCHRLRADRHEVFPVDNFSTSAWAKNVLQADISQGVPSLPVDLIYNLACPASPKWYQKMPVQTMMACVAGTKNVLDHAAHCGARVLHASTSEIYGSQTDPMEETDWGLVNPIGPRSCYDEGKRCAESLMHLYMDRIDCRIARIFNVYGPGMDLDDGRMLPNFVRQALRGEKLTVYGDGLQTRCLVYVNDMIEALMRLAESDTARGATMNLGTDEELTVHEIADTVIGVVGGDLSIQYRELPQDDPPKRIPVLSRAEDVLGWKALTPLRAGLERMVRDFRERLGEAPGASASA